MNYSQNFSLNWLKAFEAAARMSSFKLAANELCITPSAVSQQIKDLECALGVSLFHRTSQGVVLSEVGKKYWEEIKEPLALIYSSSYKLRYQNEQKAIKISVIPPIANQVIFPNILKFSQQYPEIKLNVEVSEKLVDLMTSDVDIAIRFGNPPWLGCEYERLAPVFIQPICNLHIEKELDLILYPENIVKAPLIHMANTPHMWNDYFQLIGLIEIANEETNGKDIFVNDYQAAMSAVLNYGAAIALYPFEKPYVEKNNLKSIPSLKREFGSIYAVTKIGCLEKLPICIFTSWLKEQLLNST
ncbi:LysR family transcriptional regulator [Acinetobacter baumannii]|uniref:LysR family transcriptional regulator n=1 Tax=Acinetobacter calcoaceticus/baumannii complex TaxID=909768 RepID=UPI00244AEE0A|nr:MULTISPECIES: LysR family transcriptional regulator [Acinetobacter calcoaceticus/baumannii complex]MDH2544581.1 LysR family transcriptional regulator [Acinetobacter baumannii]MDO7218895.1 LysR family transcriptional regulator [Acinetobacter nosocomialis]MDO7474002.1 LysR family transcriptional regulator [Acinetobacter baumannii]MDV7659610.1 LysR family transcriptional regulator [Acinetobacter baumannii]